MLVSMLSDLLSLLGWGSFDIPIPTDARIIQRKSTYLQLHENSFDHPSRRNNHARPETKPCASRRSVGSCSFRGRMSQKDSGRSATAPTAPTAGANGKLDGRA
jgi:hypothetical protein